MLGEMPRDEPGRNDYSIPNLRWSRSKDWPTISSKRLYKLVATDRELKIFDSTFFFQYKEAATKEESQQGDVDESAKAIDVY